MPIENNLIKATNRIAQAIEDKETQINVEAVDLSGIIQAINNLQIGGGGTGGNGSMDCNCLAIALKPIVQAINDLRKDIVCVVVPIAAGVEQIKKELGYWTEDGPHLGIDAPPGSFIFPKPGDYSPPIISTPNPTPTDPTTGGWITPPTIGGIQYVEPPGGMQGTTNATAYNDYKCDVATFIYEYVLSWYDAILQKIETVQSILLVTDVLRFLVDVLRGGMVAKIPTTTIIYDVASGVAMKKAAERVGMTLLTATEALTLGAFLISGAVATWMVGISFSEYKNNLVATKHDFICALRKARTVGEAREGVMEALNKNVWHIIDFGQGSGAQGLFIRTLLSDNLLANLFACDANLDPATIAGMGAGNCVGCLLCEEDTDVTIPVNKASTKGYPAPVGETRTGLVPYPLTIDCGVLRTDLICVVMRGEPAIGWQGYEILVNDLPVPVLSVSKAWGPSRVGGAVKIEPRVGEIFDGHVTLKFFSSGGRYEAQSFSWREITP